MPAIRQLLESLYGSAAAAQTYQRLVKLLDEFGTGPGEIRLLTERDAVLITYGDMVTAPGVTPIRCLSEFLGEHVRDLVSTVHVLPFFPYSSDDGFSVIDYRSVDPALGSWDDIAGLGRNFKLMFDAVINHMSSRSGWFQAYLRDDPAYRDWFITVSGEPDLSQVVRPRALPLLTHVVTPSGQKAVWTTFSTDQIDLNYDSPEVLLEILSTLLFYVAQGVSLIRLDAIAYLWKEIGTTCIHLPKTHRVVQLFRAVLDEVAPGVKLITETNVPHQDNVSYFGDGSNEAQLVYNFALPPLTLHTFRTGSARALSQWASQLALPSGQVTFFNFLASHDGIGLNAARDFLAGAEVDALVDQTLRHAGQVSYKSNPDGSQSAYELNISYFDALSDPYDPEPLDRQIDRFVAAQAIMLALVGVPGIYFHSLFGSRGWPEGAQMTGRARSINRQKLECAALEAGMNDPGGLRGRVFRRYSQLLRARAASPAFHPVGSQRVMDFGGSIFALQRVSPGGDARVMCLHNVTSASQRVGLPPELTCVDDLLTGQPVERDAPIVLAPYQTAWLRQLG
jgi:sucrose phosphorylase